MVKNVCSFFSKWHRFTFLSELWSWALDVSMLTGYRSCHSGFCLVWFRFDKRSVERTTNELKYLTAVNTWHYIFLHTSVMTGIIVRDQYKALNLTTKCMNLFFIFSIPSWYVRTFTVAGKGYQCKLPSTCLCSSAHHVLMMIASVCFLCVCVMEKTTFLVGNISSINLRCSL